MFLTTFKLLCVNYVLVVGPEMSLLELDSLGLGS